MSEPAGRQATPSRYWIKLDALLHRNPKVGRLSHPAFRAFVTSLCEAKLCQSEGEWPSRDHYAFAVGTKVARHFDTLVNAGLLELDDDGWVRVHDWGDWQPKDPTAAERSKRYRDRKRGDRVATRDATTRHTERREEKEDQEVDHADAPGGGGLAAVPSACVLCDEDLLGAFALFERDGRFVNVHPECKKRAAA
jgi:hypothetical protein